MERTLEQRIQLARQLKAEGMNCAQCVAMVFDDVAGIPPAQLAGVAAAFGGGIAGTRGTCGCVSGMVMIDGMKSTRSGSAKGATYESARRLMEEFSSMEGSTVCAELKSHGAKPCMTLIEDAIALLHNKLSNN